MINCNFKSLKKKSASKSKIDSVQNANNPRRVGVYITLPEKLSKSLRSKLILDGFTLRSFFEAAALDYLDED